MPTTHVKFAYDLKVISKRHSFSFSSTQVKFAKQKPLRWVAEGLCMAKERGGLFLQQCCGEVTLACVGQEDDDVLAGKLGTLSND